MAEIYTYTGSILIALNPWKHIAGLYDPAILQAHQGSGGNGAGAARQLSPHTYAVAECAFACVRRAHSRYIPAGKSDYDPGGNSDFEVHVPGH